MKGRNEAPRLADFFLVLTAGELVFFAQLNCSYCSRGYFLATLTAIVNAGTETIRTLMNVPISGENNNIRLVYIM